MYLFIFVGKSHGVLSVVVKDEYAFYTIDDNDSEMIGEMIVKIRLHISVEFGNSRGKRAKRF